MLKTFRVFVVCVIGFGLLTTSAQDPTAPTVRLPDKASATVMVTLAAEARRGLSDEQIALYLPEDAEQAQLALASAVEAFEERVQREVVNVDTVAYLELSEPVAPESFSGLSPLGAVTLAGAEAVLDQTFTTLNQRMVQDQKERADRLLRHALSNYDADFSLDSLAESNPAEVISTLEAENYLPINITDIDVDRLVDKTPEQLRSSVETEVGKLIAHEVLVQQLCGDCDEALAVGTELLGQFAQTADEVADVAEDAAQLVRIGQALWTTAIELSENLDSIDAAAKTLEAGVDSIIAAAQDEFGHEFEAGRELASLLSRPLQPTDPSDQLALGVDIAGDALDEIQRASETLANGMSDYLNTAGQLYDIAKGLGVEGDFMTDISTAISVGESVTSAVTAIASGNYMAAVGSVASALGLGGGGPDAAERAAAARHRQLVGLLKGVLKNQEVMNQKLDALIEGQQVIIRNQAEIYESLQTLRQEANEQFAVILDRFNGVETNIYLNRTGIRELIVGDTEKCATILRTLPSSAPQADPATLTFPSYDLQRAHYAEWPDTFPPCLTKLHSIMDGVGTSDSAFHYTWWLERENSDGLAESTYNDLNSFNANVWEPQYALYTTLLERDPVLTSRSGFASLIAPAKSMSDLDAKIRLLQEKPAAQVLPEHVAKGLGENPPPLTNIFRSYYSSNATTEFLDYAIKFYPYYDLQNSSSKNLKSPEQLQANPSLDETREFLNSTVLRADILVAQQALLTGDALLPLMYTYFKPLECAVATPETPSCLQRGNEHVDDTVKRFRQVLNTNPVLARNFVLYALRREINDEAGLNKYFFALSAEKDQVSFLNELVMPSTPWVMVWCGGEEPVGETNWCARFGDLDIPLPSYETLRDGTLARTPQLSEALHYRNLALEHLVAYDLFSDTLTTSDQRRMMTASFLLATPGAVASGYD